MADYKTVSAFSRNRVGNRKQTSGTFTADASCDVRTGLRRVDFASVIGIGNSDNALSVSRNTETTVDEARDAMGTIHVEGASSSTYSFIAVGS